ncbi:AI-2E family transporter [Glaciibacter flavus]|uniref:AI-2E family transporter n=1 Tax=Orlajensenia flava TaxID=2565934 RepID=A0A4S4FZC1_9MICO|nr:AI-2E family transporter [Glaciibacter flavus]THG36203.1 AI-2E family transporter [Glaciibacter flavus]
MSETSTTWWDRLFTRRPPEPEETPFSVEESIPNGVRLAGGWSWRLLVIGAVIAVAIFLIIQLRLIIIPLLIAVLVGALLVPLVGFLQRHHWPKWLAVVVTLVGTLAIVAGLLTLVVWQISRGWGDLSGKAVQSFEDLKAALLASPLQLTETQINDYIASALQSIQSDSAVFITGALSVGATLGHVGAGLLLTIFSLIFILIDGKGIWAWVVRIFPKRARAAIDGAGQAGWNTLGNFARVQILVATIDAIGIGLGAFLLGVPLAIPIAVTVFLGSFIPIVGAVVTGALACVIALIYNGWFIALMLLLVVLGVQQLEGHVLQPLVMGTAVKVHPLAVVLAVAAGSLLAGIPGALFAVPFAAVLNVMVRYISGGTWKSHPPVEPPPPTSNIWQTVPQDHPGYRTDMPPRA